MVMLNSKVWGGAHEAQIPNVRGCRSRRPASTLRPAARAAGRTHFKSVERASGPCGATRRARAARAFAAPSGKLLATRGAPHQRNPRIRIFDAVSEVGEGAKEVRMRSF